MNTILSRKYFYLLFLTLFSVCLCAQTTTQISVPYSFSFEESEAAELANWVLNPGEQAAGLTEKWIVGSATRSDGYRSLYISDNGEENHFGVGPLTQFAYRDILLPKGVYECSFD